MNFNSILKKKNKYIKIWSIHFIAPVSTLLNTLWCAMFIHASESAYYISVCGLLIASVFRCPAHSVEYSICIRFLFNLSTAFTLVPTNGIWYFYLSLKSLLISIIVRHLHYGPNPTTKKKNKIHVMCANDNNQLQRVRVFSHLFQISKHTRTFIFKCEFRRKNSIGTTVSASPLFFNSRTEIGSALL